MKKQLLAAVLTGAMIMSVTGCGTSGTATTAAKAAAATTKAATAAAATKAATTAAATTKAATSAASTTKAASTTAGAAKTTYKEATVRVAYMPNLGSASSVFTAIEQGYFKEVGLTVTPYQFQGGPAEIAAMGSGDIDISQIGHGAHKLCIQGQALVFEMDQNSLADAVVANKSKGINAVTDLKGKTVAVQSGTSSEIILKLALEKNSMKMEDIKTVEMDANGMVTAMVSGQIDACATWSPSTVSISKGLGKNYLVLAQNSDFLDKAAFPSSFITTKKYADANKDVLIRFTAAIEKAKVYRASHIEDVAKLLSKKLDVPEDTMLAATGEGDWKGAVDHLGDFAAIKTYYAAQQKVFLNAGAITAEVPIENYVDFDIMKAGNELYGKNK
jgi:NitT/TauT family transport system substrate-binding protein